MSSVYSISATDAFVYEYTVKGGQIFQISEGCLGLGDLVLFDPRGRMKTYVIREVYLNEQSSGQTIRGYNKMPGKYRKMLENAGLI